MTHKSLKNSKWKTRIRNSIFSKLGIVLVRLFGTYTYVWDIPTEEAAAVRVMEGGGTAEVLMACGGS